MVKNLLYSESSLLYNVHVQSDRTNADLCIDGKSGFSHFIFLSTNEQLCTPYPLQMAAVQESLLLSGCIYTLKKYTTKQLTNMLCKITALFPGKPPRT